MAFSEQYDSFVRDVKTLVRERPIAASTVLSVAALVAIATIIIPTIQRLSASNESEPSVTATEDRSDGEINAGNTPLSDDDIRIGADIDSLDVLLNDIELEPRETIDGIDASGIDASGIDASGIDALQQSRSLDQQRLSTALLSPVHRANEPSGQPHGDETASIYDDLFSPLVVQDTAAIEASLLPITPGTLTSEDTANVSTDSQASPSAERWEATAAASPSEANAPDQDGADVWRTQMESPTQSFSTPGSPQRSPQVLSNSARSDSASSTSSPPNASPLQPGVTTVPFQTSPLPGTTGYTAPDALRSPFNPYTQQLNPPAVPASPGAVAAPTLPNALTVPLNGTTSGQPSANLVSPLGVTPSPFITPSRPTAQPTYTVPQNTFAIPPAPSTVPPRFTGGGRGGEFNTFSNP